MIGAELDLYREVLAHESDKGGQERLVGELLPMLERQFGADPLQERSMLEFVAREAMESSGSQEPIAILNVVMRTMTDAERLFPRYRGLSAAYKFMKMSRAIRELREAV